MFFFKKKFHQKLNCDVANKYGDIRLAAYKILNWLEKKSELFVKRISTLYFMQNYENFFSNIYFILLHLIIYILLFAHQQGYRADFQPLIPGGWIAKYG